MVKINGFRIRSDMKTNSIAYFLGNHKKRRFKNDKR